MHLVVAADIAPLLSGAWFPELFTPWVTAAAFAGREKVAVYLGAANGDHPDMFSMYEAVAARVGIHRCIHVKERATPADVVLIRDRAALVILASGDPHRAWRSFVATGIDAALTYAIRAGCPALGVSAGAINLGTHGFTMPGEPIGAESAEAPYKSLGLFPFAAGAHEEAERWAALRAALALLTQRGEACVGLGLPYGSAVALHPDGTLEVGRRDPGSPAGPMPSPVHIRSKTEDALLAPGTRWRVTRGEQGGGAAELAPCAQ